MGKALLAFFYVLLFFLSLILVGKFRQYALKKQLVDQPNNRSSHVGIKPRGGGIIFSVLWLLTAVIFAIVNIISFKQLLFLLPACALVGAIGFFDDCYNLSAKVRICVHFIAALTSVLIIAGLPHISLGNYEIQLGWFGYPCAIFLLLWSTNLFNFMDGLDGIAASEALWVLGIGGGFLWMAGAYGLALLAWALVVLILGFLYWNWPPAKIFMGDVGSGMLGFVVMAFALIGQREYGLSLVIWLILYGVFWFDGSVTLLRRMLKGEKWYMAHRAHAYQRLHQAGWSHLKVVLWVWVINMILSVLAVLSFSFVDSMAWMLLATFIVLGLSYGFVERKYPYVRAIS